MRHYDLDDKPHLAKKTVTMAATGTYVPDLSVARIFKINVPVDGTVTIGDAINAFDGASFHLLIKQTHATTSLTEFGAKYEITDPAAGVKVYSYHVVYDKVEDKFYSVGTGA